MHESGVSSVLQSINMCYMTKIATLATTVLFSLGLSAQDLQYSGFSVSQENHAVHLQWVIDSGNNCNGIHILRAANGSGFEEIGVIDGVCGSDLIDVKYSFIDPSPVLNAENSYVLVFGFSQYSEERKIYVSYYDPAELYASPNPVESQLTLRWNDGGHSIYALVIFDGAGKPVLRRENIFGDELTADLSFLPAGYYEVVLTSADGRRLHEKIVRR
jgi:hypothetical protein